MLKQASLYQNALQQLLLETWDEEKYKYFWISGGKVGNMPTDSVHNGAYVSLDKDGNIVGFIRYQIDARVRSVYNFEAINFTEDIITFGEDLRQSIDDIFRKFNFNKLDFCCIEGNLIMPTYNMMVKKYGGRIVGYYKDEVQLKDGTICNQWMYEIMRDEYLSSISSNK